MTTYILTEDSFNTDLLQEILLKKAPREQTPLKNAVVFPAGGSSAVISLARSIVVRRKAPVLIVADAGSTVSEFIQDRHQDIEDIVKIVAGRTPVKVVLAIPELETVWFQDVALLSRWLGCQPSPELLVLAEFRPRKALAQLLSQSEKIQTQEQLLEQISQKELEILSQAPVIQEIVEFLNAVRQTAEASA